MPVLSEIKRLISPSHTYIVNKHNIYMMTFSSPCYIIRTVLVFFFAGASTAFCEVEERILSFAFGPSISDSLIQEKTKRQCRLVRPDEDHRFRNDRNAMEVELSVRSRSRNGIRRTDICELTFVSFFLTLSTPGRHSNHWV